MTDDLPTDDRIVAALRRRDEIVLTASDLADEIGAHRTTILDHLRDLEAVERVASIQVGAKAVGWYLPGDERRAVTGEHYLIPTYLEHVRGQVDDRGRITIGSEYAHKPLTFAILESPALRRVAAGEWEYRAPMKWQRTTAIVEDTADDRGRVRLGKDWAGMEASVAVLEVDE